MIAASFDDLIWDDHPPQQKRSPCGSKSAKIENQDGSTMFVAETVTIEIEEEHMTKKPYWHEVLDALKISWPLLLLFIAAVFGFFQLTQSRIDAQMAEVRSQISADRKSASDENAALRSDVTQGFNRAADKMDAISQRLEDKIQNSSDKADSKLDKINESIDQLRQSKPTN